MTTLGLRHPYHVSGFSVPYKHRPRSVFPYGRVVENAHHDSGAADGKLLALDPGPIMWDAPRDGIGG